MVAVFQGELHHGATPAVVAIAAKVTGLQLGEVAPGALFEDLAFDPLDRVEFAMWVEDAFHITVSDDEMEALHGLDDTVRLVEAKLARRPAHA